MAMEAGGKGSFQAVKLQRPARTTVCSHSTRDMAAVYSIESEFDHKNAHRERLCSCEQLSVSVSPKIAGRGKQGGSSAYESTTSAYLGRIQMETLMTLALRFNVPPQLIVASAVSVTAYLALLGSLLTFRSIAIGLYASAKRVRA